MSFTRTEENAIHYSILALEKEVSYYEGLVADLKKQGNKELSVNMMEKKLNKYSRDLKELKEVQKRGFFREGY